MSRERGDGVGMGGSTEEKWKRRSTFRTRFPSLLLCLDNYIDDNKHDGIVILWAPLPPHIYFSFLFFNILYPCSFFISFSHYYPTIHVFCTYIVYLPVYIFFRNGENNVYSRTIQEFTARLSSSKLLKRKLPVFFLFRFFFLQIFQVYFRNIYIDFQPPFYGPEVFSDKDNTQPARLYFLTNMTMKIVVKSSCEVL